MKYFFKSWRRQFAPLICIVFLSLAAIPALAQYWDARYANAPDAAQWKWAQEPWNGNDRPFISLRAQIDQAIAKGTKPEVLLRRYKAQSLKKWRDAPTQFAYGYSAYRASQAMLHNSRVSSVLLASVPLAMERPTFPRSYQYARLMFLVMTKSPSDERLRWAGDRLVKRDAKDYEVKRGLAKTLIYTTLLKKPEKEQAIRLVEDSIRANPKDVPIYSTKGSLYYWTSQKSRDPAEVQKVVVKLRV